MQFTIFLAHGIYGPFDELLPLVVAGLFGVLLLTSLIVQRRQGQSYSLDNSADPKTPLAKVARGVEHEKDTRVWLD